MELWEDFSEWEARERTWGDVGRRGKAGGHWRKDKTGCEHSISDALFIQVRCHHHLCLVTIVLDQRETFQSVTPILKEPKDKRPMVTTPFSVQV